MEENICKREKQRLATQRYRLRKSKENGTEHRIGIGKGGGQLKGKDNAMYSTGIREFHRLSPQIRLERKCCERCNKNLLQATKGNWCVHHKDHNRCNNEINNFELLCKRCHQIEHKCWESFNV